jgi:protein-L-isoaspartate(D-aspartate) O-methyltransferase
LTLSLLKKTYQGCVVGVDHIPELVDWSLSNIRHDGKGHLLATRSVEDSADFAAADEGGKGLPPITLVAGDGYAGWQAGAPYDAIHLGAAVESIPGALLRQLKVTISLVCIQSADSPLL